MTHTYVLCPDCDGPLGYTYSPDGYFCPCGAEWTLDGDRLKWPWRKRHRWQRWGSATWARVILLALLLAFAVFVVTVMVD